MASARDVWLATRAKVAGASYSLRIVLECRRYELPVSAGFALIQGESGFANVFGHDPTIFAGAGAVTAAKYHAYKKARDALGPNHRRMQGVGPCQLTWWEYQDRADRLGGCWVPRHNIRAGIEHFAALFNSEHGATTDRLRAAARRYNGTGAAAELYAQHFMERYWRWHHRLT